MRYAVALTVYLKEGRQDLPQLGMGPYGTFPNGKARGDWMSKVARALEALNERLGLVRGGPYYFVTQWHLNVSDQSEVEEVLPSEEVIELIELFWEEVRHDLSV